MTNLFDVSGKVALVTGGRRGIGFALAMGLRDAGAKVAVIAKSDNRGELPDEIFYTEADLYLRSARRYLVDRIADHMGGLDILVNNAGNSILASALDTMPTEWDTQFAVNVDAPFELSQQAAKIMMTHGWGRIINITSISAFNGNRNGAAYVATKHALWGMTKTLSNEWAPYGITVNCIAPGFVKTPMAARNMDPEKEKQIVGRIPVGRIATPADLVGPLLFLASDASRYITGSTIVVDGGWLAR
jgi:2-deoxy-D-gluconate 3-dehydrogenase